MIPSTAIVTASEMPSTTDSHFTEEYNGTDNTQNEIIECDWLYPSTEDTSSCFK